MALCKLVRTERAGWPWRARRARSRPKNRPKQKRRPKFRSSADQVQITTDEKKAELIMLPRTIGGPVGAWTRAMTAADEGLWRTSHPCTPSGGPVLSGRLRAAERG
ncbi:glutathione ABC transporter ATP-binding protein [Streptomyces sp. NBRC 110611]|nr:glutathione ABC transporter ATP-binding protein [Streptomyces sp. NBRC 110611]